MGFSYPNIPKSCWLLWIFTLSPASLVSTMMSMAGFSPWWVSVPIIWEIGDSYVKQWELNTYLIQVHQIPHLTRSSIFQILGSAQTIKEITRENLQAVMKNTAVQMVRYLWFYPNGDVPHISSQTASLLTKVRIHVWICVGWPQSTDLFTYAVSLPRPHSPHTKVAAQLTEIMPNYIHPDLLV